jgi:hypothetical protein
LAACNNPGTNGSNDLSVTPGNPDLSQIIPPGTDGNMPPPNGMILPGPSHGSAIALSPDDSIAVVVNRDVGTVSVMQLTYPAGAVPVATKVAEVAVGIGSEPWQAVVSPDGTRAFVILRKAQQLVAIEGLTGTPTMGAAAAVGSEPTGLALTPTGAQAWVANWVDGTLTSVDTSSMTVARTVDLNAALVATNTLGSITARPSLAHPRALAITNNGDNSDSDETILATEYFSQRSAPESANANNADTSKEGIVYQVKLSDFSASTITLGAITDMGFRDHLNGVAGCYPNQLQSVTINGAAAYVTSICASPQGPLGPFTKAFKVGCTLDTDCVGPATVVGRCNVAVTGGVCTTNCASNADCEPNGGVCNTTTGVCNTNVADVKTTTAPLVSVIDLNTFKEVTSATASLNTAFFGLYTTRTTPDDGTRKFPLFPIDMAFVPGTQVGYVAANGADAVFRVKYDPTTNAITEVGSSTSLFIDLNPPGIAAASAGLNPIGVVVTNVKHNGKAFLLSANDVGRNLSIVDLEGQQIAGGTATPDVVATTAPPASNTTEFAVLKGKRFFNTGVGRWSLKGQAWGACSVCHSDGLTDNVTWYFARGPRQSVSLDGSFSKQNPTDQRIFNWTAIFDELPDFEGNVRGVSGGVGAIVSATSAPPANADRINFSAGLVASSTAQADPTSTANPKSVINDWINITAFVRAIRSPRRPTNLDSNKVTSGRQLFEANNCQGCHGGDKWTISHVFYTPDQTDTENQSLKTKTWSSAGLPPAMVPASGGNQVMRYPGANPAAFDQLTCMLRPVGTFGASEPEVALNGAFPEIRADMKTKAQGSGDTAANAADIGAGYNPPALLGTNIGAPYFHSGGARTLEAAFSTRFQTHYQALSSNFLTDAEPARSQEVDELVQFLLSIDNDQQPSGIPASVGSSGGDFCAP